MSQKIRGPSATLGMRQGKKTQGKRRDDRRNHAGRAILYRPPTIGTVILVRGRGVTRNGSFFNLYNHDFVRIAVGVPSVRVADPAYNADQTIALIREAADRKAVLALFPELGLTAYSCDDLFQQRALLDACLDAIATVVEATAKLSIVSVVGAPLQIDQSSI